MNLSPLPQADGLVKAVIELWEGGIALVLAESMDIGVDIGIKSPVAQYALVSKVDVVEFGLAPYEIKLCGDYKGGNVKDEVGKG